MIARGRPAVVFLTPGRIAELTQQPLHRIQYILRTRLHIKPRARAGRLRVYDQAALDEIRSELAAIDARAGPPP